MKRREHKAFFERLGREATPRTCHDLLPGDTVGQYRVRDGVYSRAVLGLRYPVPQDEPHVSVRNMNRGRA